MISTCSFTATESGGVRLRIHRKDSHKERLHQEISRRNGTAMGIRTGMVGSDGNRFGLPD